MEPLNTFLTELISKIIYYKLVSVLLYNYDFDFWPEYIDLYKVIWLK